MSICATCHDFATQRTKIYSCRVGQNRIIFEFESDSDNSVESDRITNLMINNEYTILTITIIVSIMILEKFTVTIYIY